MDYIGFGYAAAVAAGGIVGYVKAGDTVVFISTLRIKAYRIAFPLVYPKPWQGRVRDRLDPRLC